jgi:TfoX/Sxy family transcriptional regulator of competence genes
MKMPQPTAEAVHRFETLISGDLRVQIRKMFGHPCGFVNGHMCVGTFGDDVFVRLSETDHRRASKVRGVRSFEPIPGRPMKEYVVLPSSLLKDPSRSKKWVERSIAYASTLPAKRSSGRRSAERVPGPRGR